jgi:superfamily II RNA helicase
MMTTTPETTYSDIFNVYKQMLPYPLDGFQEEAIQHIDAGKSVVVCAPTGAGKTAIAEFAALKAMDEGRKLIYTTPLKALSNQKYNDLKERFGEGNVGLLTGDQSVNREARIVVMTTEVFRNLLYGLNEDHTLLQNVNYVVLDECHFMNDADRGTVWEESIVYCPPKIQLVALSATVANSAELTNWINSIHPTCELVWSDFRPVPLRFYFSQGSRVVPLFESGSKKLLNKQLQHDRVSTNHRHRTTPFNPMNLVDELYDRDMLPAIFFTFSRKGCDNNLRACANLPLTSADEKAQVQALIDSYASQATVEIDEVYHQALLNGIASHHAGLLPGVKMLVETLFQRNLLKVVFATETLAAGINMPARTTVITAISKRTNEGHRLLTASEFLQMSGRAGRRGLDVQGHVVVVKSPFNTAQEAAKIASSPAEPLKSQFTPTYGMVLNLLQKSGLEEVEFMLGKSFGAFTTDKRTQPISSQLEERQALLDEVIHFPCPHSLSLEQFQAHLGDRELMTELNRQANLLKKQHRKYGDDPVLLGDIASVKERSESVRDLLEESPCSQCDSLKTHRRLEEKVERLGKQVKRLETEVEAVTNIYWEQFLRLFDLLSEMGYIELNQKPTPLGVLTSNIRTENELFVAEALREKVLEDLAPEELAAVVSAMVNDSTRDNVQNFVTPSKGVKKALSRLFKLKERVENYQGRFGITTQVNLNPVASPLVEVWAKGTSWTGLIGMTTLDQGDLVRNLRRTCDLLRQLAKTPNMPDTISRTAHTALEAILRDPVKEMDFSQSDL